MTILHSKPTAQKEEDLHHGHIADYHHHGNDDHHGNHGLLRYLFSKVGGKTGDRLRRHRGKIVLGAASAIAAFEYGTFGATTLSSQFAMVAGAAVLAHDSSEDLMTSVEGLKESHKINSGVIGMAAGAAHTGSEFLLSAFAQAGNYTDMVIATTMGSNVSHIPLMVGTSALIGAVSIDRLFAYKMNSTAIAAVTGAFGYQVATGEFNPYLSAGMVGAGLGYIYWRMKAGQTCAHDDACEIHYDKADDTDYLSVSYWRDVAKKLKTPKPSVALSRLNESVRSVKEKLSSLSIPKPQEIYTKLKNVTQSITHPNILTLGASLGALGLSAHILGNNVVKMAEIGGMSTTAMGVTVAALAFALPELILTGKAAAKKDGELAWGAITGCTVATVGIVGGYQGLNGFEIPASLDLAITEGKVQMAAFLGSAAAIIAAAHPKVAKQLAKVDNAVADLFENRIQAVSDWLRNDGTKISKTVAAPMLAAALSFYALNTLPVCHSHGTWVHCFNPVPTEVELPSQQEAIEALRNSPSLESGPDF